MRSAGKKQTHHQWRAKKKKGNNLVTLTWAEDDINSWDNKSTQSAESTAIAPHSPSQTRVYTEKVKSPALGPLSLPPSVQNGAFLHLAAHSSWIAFSLVPDKPEPPAEGAELNLAGWTQARGGWEVEKVVVCRGETRFRTLKMWAELPPRNPPQKNFTQWNVCGRNTGNKKKKHWPAGATPLVVKRSLIIQK